MTLKALRNGKSTQARCEITCSLTRWKGHDRVAAQAFLPIVRRLCGAGLGLSTPPIATGQAPTEKPSRDQQIADIEKQIKGLQQKLEELKRGGPAPTVPDGVLNPEWVKTFHWRSIGPAAMGGRIIALSIFEADPGSYWVATASGGLLKTVNNGITFEHQLDHEATVSIGDVCVAQSDRNIVWVGTGENNPRNSVSYGDGVYKSTDGGKTWKNMGLKKTYQIGKIIVHPKDPNIVYVGALGRLWGPNEERGLFKTTDGGQNWQKILYVDDRTGVIDIRMHPSDPETLIVATWERQRDYYDSHRGDPPLVDGFDAYDPIKKWGPGSGLHKTTDGGKTFKKLTKGLPTNPIGRVGLDWYLKDPKIVYAVIDCEKIGGGTVPPPPGFLGVSGEDADDGARLTQVLPNTPAARGGFKPGDIVIAAGMQKIEDFFDLIEALRGKKAGDKITFKVRRDQMTVEIPVTADNP